MLSTKRKLVCLLFIVGLSFSCKSFSRLFTKGGTEMTVQVETNEQNKDELVNQAVKIIQFKLDSIGQDGEVIRSSDKPNQISVKIYGTNDLEKVKKFLLTTYQLELKHIISPSSPSPVQTYPTQEAALANIQPNQEVLPYNDRDAGTGSAPKFVVEKEPIVTGADLRSASAMNIGNSYKIAFSLKPDGAEKLGRWTGMNINNYLAIVLNKEVVSAAYIKSQIFDQGQIDGKFTKETAENIAMNLNSGYFPGTLKLIEEKPFQNSEK